MRLFKVVIWGASGHALVVADILRLEGRFEIVGMIDDVNRNKYGQIFGGISILGGKEQLEILKRSGTTHAIVAIGNCHARQQLAITAVEQGFFLATAVHPRSVIASDTSIGEGTVIVAGAVVNSGATIGRNCIINTNASVDHECSIGDGAHVGPGVRLGGRTKVGAGAWIGIGATILDRIQIGEGSIVGAGSVVTKDIPARVVAYGVPSKVVRKIDTPS